jgi:hypothetical protein
MENNQSELKDANKKAGLLTKFFGSVYSGTACGAMEGFTNACDILGAPKRLEKAMCQGELEEKIDNNGGFGRTLFNISRYFSNALVPALMAAGAYKGMTMDMDPDLTYLGNAVNNQAVLYVLCAGTMATTNIAALASRIIPKKEKPVSKVELYAELPGR